MKFYVLRSRLTEWLFQCFRLSEEEGSGHLWAFRRRGFHNSVLLCIAPTIPIAGKYIFLPLPTRGPYLLAGIV